MYFSRTELNFWIWDKLLPVSNMASSRSEENVDLNYFTNWWCHSYGETCNSLDIFVMTGLADVTANVYWLYGRCYCQLCLILCHQSDVIKWWSHHHMVITLATLTVVTTPPLIIRLFVLQLTSLSSVSVPILLQLIAYNFSNLIYSKPNNSCLFPGTTKKLHILCLVLCFVTLHMPNCVTVVWSYNFNLNLYVFCG